MDGQPWDGTDITTHKTVTVHKVRDKVIANISASPSVNGSKCSFDLNIATTYGITTEISIAVYDYSGRLIGVASMPAYISASGTKLPMEVTVSGTPYKYKVLLWENPAGAKPHISSEYKTF